MNFKSGFLRLWIVASVINGLHVLSLYEDEIQHPILPPQVFVLSGIKGEIEDITGNDSAIRAYKSAEALTVFNFPNSVELIAPKERTELQSDSLVRFSHERDFTRESDITWARVKGVFKFLTQTIANSLVMLLAGFVVLWVWRGFKPKAS